MTNLPSTLLPQRKNGGLINRMMYDVHEEENEDDVSSDDYLIEALKGGVGNLDASSIDDEEDESQKG